mmetsp:Transcript_4867/g.7366  ORF Transcript_4867/g.7366 Transcript_4867/m.7366 type:complete len:605 (+) Transcript_4867:433-2247(+)
MVEVCVLFGSQTGSAEEVSERVARDLSNRNFSVRTVCSLDAYDRLNLVNEEVVVFVVATTGDGDVPDNMKLFWRFLLRKGLPPDILSSLRFAVFGLGDSSYAKYNYVARMLGNRLLKLGATEIVDRGFGDDQSENGLEGDLDAWLSGVFSPQILAAYPLPPGFVIDDSPKLCSLKNKGVTLRQAQLQGEELGRSRDSLVSAGRRPLGCYETVPLNGVVRENKRITSADWDQDVRHISLEVSDCPKYVPGDVAIVYPVNACDKQFLVNFATRVGLGALESVIYIKGDGTVTDQGIPREVTIGELLTRYLDILGTPRRRFFETLYFFTQDEEEKEKLLEFCSAEGNDLFHSYCKKERKTYVDVFNDFRTCKPPIEYLVEMIPVLQPREYSIASSRKSRGEHTVELTVALLKYTTPWGRNKTGVCSLYVDKQLVEGSQVTIYIKRGVLRVPEDPTVPMVLVGPGTGVAPMRSIIQDISSTNTHLYFGCRSKSKDYYYENEWNSMLSKRQLGSLRTAFSRDQAKKIYVQTLLKEDKQKLWDLLVEQGGYCYISGSAKKMPTDVKDSLVWNFACMLRERGEGEEASQLKAEQFIKQMERKGKFKIESWS